MNHTRQSHKNNKLCHEQKELLDGICFMWCVYRGHCSKNIEKWEEWLTELEQYTIEHGHCNVPAWTGKIGTWAQEQR